MKSKGKEKIKFVEMDNEKNTPFFENSETTIL